MAKKSKKLCQLFISRSSGILDEKISNIKKSLRGKINFDTDYRVFDNPNDLDEKELINYLSIPPFFSENKVIVIKNIKDFPKRIINILTEHIKALEENSTIFYLITASSKKIDKKLLNAVKSKGIIKEIREPKTQSVKKWLKEKQQLDGIKLTEKASENLLENIDYQLQRLKNEYEKLFLYAQTQENKKVDTDAVNHLVSRVYDLRIFDLVDFIGSKNKAGAIKALKSMLLENQNLIGVVTLAYRMFKSMLYISLGEAKKAYGYIKSNVPYYFVDKTFEKYKKYLNNYTEEEIKKALGLLNSADISLRKNLVNEKNIVSKLISEICN